MLLFSVVLITAMQFLQIYQLCIFGHCSQFSMLQLVSSHVRESTITYMLICVTYYTGCQCVKELNKSCVATFTEASTNQHQHTSLKCAIQCLKLSVVNISDLQLMAISSSHLLGGQKRTDQEVSLWQGQVSGTAYLHHCTTEH